MSEAVRDRSGRAPTLVARIDRLPFSRHLAGLVARIATGGWFEFFELFLPGFISLGLIKAGLYTVASKGLFDSHSFASFLASFFFGMFLSTIIFGGVSDRFGRRSVFVYTMLVYSAANIVMAFQSSPAVIDLLRFIAGFAVGMQLINNDSYITEITPRRLRGRYMAFAFTLVLTAVPVAALLATLLVPHAPLGLDGWRWVILLGGVAGFVVLLIQRGLPESPRWLATNGRHAEAERVIAAIETQIAAESGRPLPPPDTTAPDIAPARGDWREMFGRFYLPRTIVISLFQFCQTVGVFGFTAWAPILLVKQGFTIVHSLDYTFMIVLLTPVGGLLGTWLSERFERKWQLVAAAFVVGIAGFTFALSHHVAMILVSGALIALGNNWMIAIFHSYAAELFPTRIRAQAIGFTFAWSRVSAIFVGYWVAALLAGYGTAGVFAMIGAAMLAIVISVGAFAPPTNGRSLEELSP